MPLADQVSLWHLFWSAFLSATILPGGSEALLTWLIAKSSYSSWQLITAATIGNTLGSLLTWTMGRLLRQGYTLPRLTNITERSKGYTLVKRYGIYSLLLSWLPLIGDGICLICGYLKTPFLASTLLILIGKASRYVLIWSVVS